MLGWKCISVIQIMRRQKIKFIKISDSLGYNILFTNKIKHQIKVYFKVQVLLKVFFFPALSI